MAYDKYQKIMSQDEFYQTWEQKKFNELTESLKVYVYEKYTIKANILQRDSFTCQNLNCSRCKNVQFYNKLTIHHIKFKKNKGKNSERNGVTLCYSIHNGNSGYHNAKAPLVFSDNAVHLPPHIRGHTFQLQKPDRIDWKALRARLSILRKELKHDGVNTKIDWDTIYMLFKWLYIPYTEMEDD